MLSHRNTVRELRVEIPHKRVAAVVLLVFVLGLALLAGLWRGRRRGAGQSAADAPCVDIRDAGKHVGEQGCVTGRVVGVVTSRAGNTFLDFCPDYRHCPFSTVIFASDRNKFGDLESLRGQQVEIRGPITVYRSRPQIIIHDPRQIRMAR
ncbi:MAG: hypothetical protein LAP13_19155 [Acidobacteriia bacterium]|nr:hypothetical protein [Terriglobia bacterium]